MTKIIDINRKQREKELFDKLDKLIEKLPPERKGQLIAQVEVESEKARRPSAGAGNSEPEVKVIKYTKGLSQVKMAKDKKPRR